MQIVSAHVPRRGQAGLVLLTILIFVLMTTMAAGGMVHLYQTQLQREKEEELLFVGDQYRRAIASYFNTSPPGSARSLPVSIDVLLEDIRFPTPIQHLRRRYPDPITGKSDWHLVLDRGGIVGVHSQSTLVPFKPTGFPYGYQELENKSNYSEWIFSVKIN